MANITKLYLLSVPIEADYKHTLYFENKTAQQNYFTSKAIPNLKYDNFSYQIKDNKVRIPKHFDDITGKVNYVMYQNTAYSNKWFYAFILDMKYINDGVTELYIKTDVLQTWFFDYELKSCFVEREHTKDDTIGKNTIPEGLETGEYICNNTIHNRSTESTTYIIASAVNLSTGADSGLTVYGGVVNGWYYYYFDSIKDIEETLGNLAELRTNDAIVSMFVMPKEYVRTLEGESAGRVTQDYSAKYTMWEEIKQLKGLDGYIPKNNKVLTYPYNYLLVDNNAGASAVYKYELFDPDYDTCDFSIYCAITPGGSMRLVPLRYNGVTGENNNHGLPGGKFPVCGWQSDYYTNWLTQNALNIQVQTESINLTAQQNALNDIGAGIGGAVSLDWDVAAKSVTDMYFNYAHQQNQIKGIVAQKQIHRFQSPTVAGNTNTGDVNFVKNNIRFSAYQMSVKQEFARVIDNYFSMYGYQTNRVKIPNKNHRGRYWYIKTVGCDIDGNIPNSDIQTIKSCYDNGVTFWKNASTVGVYTYYDEITKNDELHENPII